MVPCMNCKNTLAQSDAKIFAECLLCPDCYRIATRIHAQAQNELQQLLVTMKETIRLAIVRGHLGFPEKEDAPPEKNQSAEQQPRAIDFIIDTMKEKKKCQSTSSPSTKSNSKPTLKLPATTPDADGKTKSASTPTQGSESETSCTQTQKTELSTNA